MIIDEPTHHINVEHIDMQGQFVYPAFIDCHLHLMGYGQFLSRLHAKGYSNKTSTFTVHVSNHLNLHYDLY
jgi:predicted amidohydrolase YtcJ